MNMKQRIQQVGAAIALAFKRLLSLLPTKLPVGRTALEKFTDEIIELAGDYAKNLSRDSQLFTISSIVINLGPQRSSVPKNYFVRTLRAAAAKQVAGTLFTEIKERRTAEERKQREEAAKQSPAIPPTA